MAFTDDGVEKLHIILHGFNSSLDIKNTSDHNDISNYENCRDESSSSADYVIAGILDANLTTFTTGQRVAFIITITTLFLLSICGNIGTLYVNMRRKIRPFFRACLISLAISDLLSTVFLSVAYLSQITADYVQIWRLGSSLCTAVPFITTSAILASSITLVGIALDRYFAVMKAVIGFWNPGVVFCIVCMFIIWATAIGIASPVLWIFSLIQIYIFTPVDVVTTEMTPGIVTSPAPPPPPLFKPATPPKVWSSSSWEPNVNISEELERHQRMTYVLVNEKELVMMCVSQQHNVGLYYAIVFAIIFIPSIIAFIWLNSIIAKKLWIRRHTVTHAKRQPKKEHLKNSCKNRHRKETPKNFVLKNEKLPIPAAAKHNLEMCNCEADNSQSSTVPSSIAMTLGGGPLPKTAHCVKEATVTLPLASAPGTSTTSNHCSTSTNNYSARESRHIRMFSIIVLLMAVFLLFRLPAWIFLIMRMYGSYTKSSHWIIYFSLGILNLTSCVLNPVFYTFLAETIQCVMIVKVKICDNWCGLRFLSCSSKTKTNIEHSKDLPDLEKQQSSLHWFSCCCCLLGEKVVDPEDEMAMQKPSPAKQEPHQLQPSKDDKDEGVECSEDSDSFHGCYNEYNQQIYTIYPMALVSSSIGSE